MGHTMNMKSQATSRSCKRTNDIIEDHGDWLLVDISTTKYPEARMAVDTDIFKNHNGGRIYAFKPASSKYIYARFNYKNLIINLHKKVIRCHGKQTDHIKHGTMSFIDNRRGNLRPVTSSQNGMNTGILSNNKSGILGVCWNTKSGKWHSHITIDGKQKHLGYYDNIDFAIGARKQAERELFGEYAFEGGSK